MSAYDIVPDDSMVDEVGVGGGESTFDSPPTASTDRPHPTPLIRYWGLRVTTPHADRDKLTQVLLKYSRFWLAGMHSSHASVDNDPESKEHFHIILPDLDDKTKDALAKALRKEFDRSGQAFYAFHKYDNTVYKAIQYIRHDPSATFFHWGSGWPQVIAEAPEWEENPQKKGKEPVKENMSFPILSPFNVVKQALKWRKKHNMKTTDIRVVLEHMTRVGMWYPNPHIKRHGLDPLDFQMFTYHANNQTGKCPNWWDTKHI